MDKRVVRPIELTLYDPETNEVVQTYVRSYIPWGILKRALAMRDALAGGEPTEEMLDELASLVVAVFGDQFTVEQATAGADAGEMVAVIQAIMARAGQFVTGEPGNPTKAAG